MKRAGDMQGQAAYGLLNDIMFKHVFGDERDLTPLCLLVNGLLGKRSGERIEMAVLRTPVVEREDARDRCSIFDLSARDTKDRLYIVEVQREFHHFFGERMLHYLSRLYGRGLKKGEKYREQKKTLLLGILDFELFCGSGNVKSTFMMRNEQREVLSGHFAAVCVELGKVSWKEPEELATSEEKWWHILKFGELYNDRERLPGPLAEEEGLEMVMDKVKQANRSPRMRALIEAHEKIRRDNENFLDDAIVEAEERRNREIAKALKLEKVDAAAIARATGMSVAEIEAL